MFCLVISIMYYVSQISILYNLFKFKSKYIPTQKIQFTFHNNPIKKKNTT